MAKRDSLVIGLDIGTTKICTVVGEISEGRVNIIGLGTFPSKGLQNDDADEKSPEDDASITHRITFHTGIIHSPELNIIHKNLITF